MSFGWWGKVKIKGSKCACNSALGKQKHVDLEFQVILGYIYKSQTNPFPSKTGHASN